MAPDASLLCLTAASVGVVHTLLGPDHYLPFLFLSRALGWSRRRTMVVTLLCGVGHVLGSIALGAIGIGLGVALTRLQVLESNRGQIAAWLLIAFGIAYGIWGLRRAQRRRPHTHLHVHGDGLVHRHEHVHEEAHLHPHAAATTDPRRLTTVTPWILFTIFVFGPCEALIPLLMYPAAQQSVLGTVAVTLVFATATLATMTLVVLVGHAGLERLPLARLERYTHALAGGAIACCGLAIQVFQL